MGSQLGIVLAAILFAGLPELFRPFAEYRMLVFGLITIAIMRFRPRGLISHPAAVGDSGMSAILTVRDLTMRFGGLVAVDSVSFEVQPDKITALIGPNGAGKTTLFNCLTGFYRPTAGSIRLNGGGALVELSRLPGHRIAHLGVARTFQNIRLFPRMTVLENLMVAQHTALMRASVFSIAGLLGLPSIAGRSVRRWTNPAIGWIASACLVAPTMPPTRCPMASSGVSRSSGRFAPAHACCAWTNRWPG